MLAHLIPVSAPASFLLARALLLLDAANLAGPGGLGRAPYPGADERALDHLPNLGAGVLQVAELIASAIARHDPTTHRIELVAHEVSQASGSVGRQPFDSSELDPQLNLAGYFVDVLPARPASLNRMEGERLGRDSNVFADGDRVHRMHPTLHESFGHWTRFRLGRIQAAARTAAAGGEGSFARLQLRSWDAIESPSDPVEETIAQGITVNLRIADPRFLDGICPKKRSLKRVFCAKITCSSMS